MAISIKDIQLNIRVSGRIGKGFKDGIVTDLRLSDTCVWYAEVTCDDGFVFEQPISRLLHLDRQKTQKVVFRNDEKVIIKPRPKPETRKSNYKYFVYAFLSLIIIISLYIFNSK